MFSSTGCVSNTEPVDGIDTPDAFVVNETDFEPIAMPDTEGRWATTRFVEPTDLRHDMHVNIVTFQPGGVIPIPETHVMEHGIYVLEGKAVYKLNQDWVEVEAGDYMWLRAILPSGLLRRRARPVPLSAVQRCQQTRETRALGSHHYFRAVCGKLRRLLKIDDACLTLLQRQIGGCRSDGQILQSDPCSIKQSDFICGSPALVIAVDHRTDRYDILF